MDRTSGFGPEDRGSIPLGSITKFKSMKNIKKYGRNT